MLEQAQQALKQYFGHDAFYPNQRELIAHILAGEDVLAVMPTGAGKSMVYQIPAIVSDGLAIVISPLISLMKDQVDALRQVGVRAAYLNSSQSAEEQSAVLHYASSGSCKLLYVAPERLAAPKFVSLCKGVKLSCVAVDEAHCVSQWGQDFRPDYMRIAGFIEGLPSRPVVCALTATATPDAQAEIVRALELKQPFVLVSGFDRPNLYFGVERPAPKEKRACLLRLLRARKNQVGIVYCSTRATVEDVCEFLCDEGFLATRYHAGLDSEERQANQEDFLYDRKTVMVATNAFGMGIDKSNVNFVIHYNMPKDVESYYQEAGRAGRDGSPADCILIYNAKDVQTCQFLIDRSRDEHLAALGPAADAASMEAVDDIRDRDCERLRQMVAYCNTTGCLRAFILRYFGQEDHPRRCEHCSTCAIEFVKRDVTVDAQKILSCVARLAQRDRRVGKTTIVDILRGSKAERLHAQGDDSLSTYGIMADTPAKHVRAVLDALIEAGYLSLSVGDYPVVSITGEGMAFLKRGERFEIEVERVQTRTTAKAQGARRKGEGGEGAAGEVRRGIVSVAPVDQDLFERLKALRLRLAAAEHVPAYIVFSNATLADMCRVLPTTPEEFLAVSGVGQLKAQRYGKAFLDCIAEYLEI